MLYLAMIKLTNICFILNAICALPVKEKKTKHEDCHKYYINSIKVLIKRFFYCSLKFSIATKVGCLENTPKNSITLCHANIRLTFCLCYSNKTSPQSETQICKAQSDRNFFGIFQTSNFTDLIYIF